MFKPSGIQIGQKLQLNYNIQVMKGTFFAGSVMEVLSQPDQRGEFLCKDLDSGETVYLHPSFVSYKVIE